MLKCSIEAEADRLVSQLEAKELPQDFEPGGAHYNEILANLRHRYTNYEELLYELPGCGGCQEWDVDRTGIECPYKTTAHDTLKWAAKNLVEEMYQEWLDQKRGKVSDEPKQHST